MFWSRISSSHPHYDSRMLAARKPRCLSPGTQIGRDSRIARRQPRSLGTKAKVPRYPVYIYIHIKEVLRLRLKGSRVDGFFMMSRNFMISGRSGTFEKLGRTLFQVLRPARFEYQGCCRHELASSKYGKSTCTSCKYSKCSICKGCVPLRARCSS